MPQVGDRGVAVLEIEAFQEFLRIVRAYPLDRIANRIRRAAVAGQRVGALLWRHGRHRNDAFGGGQDAIINRCAFEYRRFTRPRSFPLTLTGRLKMPVWISARCRT